MERQMKAQKLIYALAIGACSAALLVANVAVAKGAASRTLAGEVIGISDGDTLTILDHARTTHKIRLAYIDAPESAQPFGNKAKQALSTICFRKMARVAVIDTDRYGRSVGVVQCAGVDANKSMVAGGFAWVYRKYVPKDSELFALQTKARGEKIGLWVDASPTPPWDFRRLGDNG